MRPILGLALLASGGVALACLMVGVSSAATCPPGMAPVVCLGGSVSSVRDLFGIASAAFATVAGLFVASVLWQVRRHRRLAGLLEGTASRGMLAGFEVGLVPGLGAPCVAGLVRPRIYCPADLAERLDAGELRAVLIHERHHQRTHAPARLILLAAIAPVGRVGMCGSWLEGRRAAIEIAADVHALDAGAGRPELARALFKLGSASLAPGLPSYTSASELRLRHLVGETSPSRRGLGSLVPFVLPVVAFGACVAWGLVA